jgi:poly-gamma-glutamate synthesis protein (capsule biosynthesis protein)
MLGRLVNETIRERGPRHIWGNVLPLLRAADLALVNLECVVAKDGEPFMPRRAFYFRADPKSAEALTVAGIDYVSLANNHAMDFRAPGLLETVMQLDDLGIAHAGAGRDLEAASQHVVLEAEGLEVGVLSFADQLAEYSSGEGVPGTNVIVIDSVGPDLERVRSAISAVRSAGVDLVVFSIHWGPNMRQTPSPQFVGFAHAVMDAGADIFHGHSAHVFQGIEIYRGKAIFYDTGDLIDDYMVDPALRNDQQLLFVVKATAAGVQRVELVPLFIDRMQVSRARGADFRAIGERVARLSRPFGTTIRREGDRFVVEVRREK